MTQDKLSPIYSGRFIQAAYEDAVGQKMEGATFFHVHGGNNEGADAKLDT